MLLERCILKDGRELRLVSKKWYGKSFYYIVEFLKPYGLIAVHKYQNGFESPISFFDNTLAEIGMVEQYSRIDGKMVNTTNLFKRMV